MRAVLAFWLAIAGTMLAVAVLAWPLYSIAHAIEPGWAFNKVMSRSWQLAMLVAIGLVIHRLGLASRADWGYGLPRPVFLRQFALGSDEGTDVLCSAGHDSGKILILLRRWHVCSLVTVVSRRPFDNRHIHRTTKC